ncbi:DNA internalization-related competence protein ComEC/Rec2 [Lacticaseibacillus mingshuiensis]|nr:DNA internalization-related competence protein ComEC/Rec2 [Lacticaseibacillus mingshuiensis]
MTRRWVFAAAFFAGGLYLWLGPWWVGGVLVGWAVVKNRWATWPLMLGLFVLGMGFGWRGAAATRDPPKPSGPVIVLPTNWSGTDTLLRYTGIAANGVPVSGSAVVAKEEADRLRTTTLPQVVQWHGDLTRLQPARNQYEFDYARYVWDHDGLAYESPRQPLVVTPFAPRTLTEHLTGLRAKLLARVQQLPETIRRYAKGLLLGQVDAELDDMRDDLVQLGIFHLFSVSGLHLFALLAGLIWLTDRLRIPKEAAEWALIALLPLLPLLLGGGAGIVRAVWLSEIRLVTARMRLPLSRLDGFSLVLMGNLALQPYILHTFGGQLTYLLAGALYLLPPGPRLKLNLQLGLIGLPVILAHTFRFHLLQVLFNWLLVPVFELAVMPLVLVTLIFPDGPWTGPLERGLQLGEQGLHALTTLPGDVIFGAVPTGLAVLGVGVVLLSLARRQKRWLIGWLVAAWLVANVHPQWRVTLFDVGQGDAILIEAPFKQAAVLVDTGGRGFGTVREPPAKRAIVNYLHARGLNHLDILVLTHADADHVGDAGLLTQLMPVRRLVTTTLAANHRYILAAKAGQVVSHTPLLAPATLTVGPLKLKVVAPESADAKEKNADSLVLYGKIDKYFWLLTGDADRAVESKIAPLIGQVDMLKVGHHGSRTSSDPAFIAQIDPKLALILAGVNNRYGHPHEETLETFAAQGVPVLNTADRGMIWVSGQQVFTQLTGAEAGH